jgi:hypothetical protein
MKYTFYEIYSLVYGQDRTRGMHKTVAYLSENKDSNLGDSICPSMGVHIVHMENSNLNARPDEFGADLGKISEKANCHQFR